MRSCKNSLLKTLLTASLMVGSLLGTEYAMAASDSPTLKLVKDRGALNCTAHNGDYPGFAEIGKDGKWKGLDADLCRAVTVAIFGDITKVNFKPISWAQRWPALRNGDVDVIIKLSGGTLTRNAAMGFEFSRPYYLGSARVMVRKELGVKSVKELDGATICVDAGISQQKQMEDYTRKLGIKVKMMAIDDPGQLRNTIYTGGCDGYVQFEPAVAIMRALAPKPDEFVMLPDRIALEPEVAIVRDNDDKWLDVINWTLSALWFAEEKGITSKNVDQIKANPPDPQVAKFLGVTKGVGDSLGLSDNWAYNVIKQVGNYGEIWDRNLGKDSPYKIDRGLNALWDHGGVHYPMVFD